MQVRYIKVGSLQGFRVKDLGFRWKLTALNESFRESSEQEAKLC